MKIKIADYKKNMNESKIKGFANIEITVDGFPLTINGVKIIESPKGGNFYALPSREYTNQAGEKKYSAVCGFFSKDGYAEFHAGMTEAFNKHFNAPAGPQPDATPPPVQSSFDDSDDGLPF